MSKYSLLIAGAGLSLEPARLPGDENFLYEQREKIRGDDSFLIWALNHLYSDVVPQQRSIKDYSSIWEQQRLETVWSEIDANAHAPKFVLDKEDIGIIKQELLRLAEAEIVAIKSYQHYYYHAFEEAENRTPYEMLFRFADWELRKLVLETYGRKRFSLLSEEHQKCYTNLLEKVFHDAGTKCVISFNYDILLDEAIENKLYLHVRSTTKQGEVLFIKPHGSINWYQTGENIIELEDPVSPEKIGYSDGRLHQHSIVPPIDKKWVTRPDYKAGGEKLLYAYNLPSAMEEALLHADEINIIGYGFPIGDQHIRSLMTSALKKRRGNNIPPCSMVRCINPSASSMRFTIENLFWAKDADSFRYFDEKWTDWI